MSPYDDGWLLEMLATEIRLNDPKTVVISALDGDTLEVVRIEVDPAFLGELDEAERCSRERYDAADQRDRDVICYERD